MNYDELMNSDPLGVHTWQTVSANPSDDFGIIGMTLPPPPTYNTKSEPWRSEVEPATSQSQRLPTILNRCGWAEKTLSVSLKPAR